MNLTLETKRLNLKPILSQDLKAFHNILSDHYVRKYLCDDKIFSLKQTKEMLEENQKLFTLEKLGLWFIETKSESQIIGFVGLWYFFAEQQPQLVYALLPQATKQGYATEAATRTLEYCFEELDYNYLVASADKPNLESHNVVKRLDMKQVGEKEINEKPIIFFRIEKTINK